MKIYDAKCLNKKIVEAMRKNEPQNIERLDNDGFEMMIEELATEDLSIITFEALADIYKAEYKFTLIYMQENNSEILLITSKDVLWSKLNDIYMQHTGKYLNSLNRTFKEIVDKFNEINITIIFE